MSEKSSLPESEPVEMKPRFEISFLADRSDESFLEEIRRIAALLPEETPLSQSLYERHAPRISVSGLRSRFGSWKRALELAGLEHLHVGKRDTISREMLISEIRRVSDLVGSNWLTAEQFDAHSIYSKYSVGRRFGSFSQGLTAAGIQSHPQSKTKGLSDAECFENIAHVWTSLGRSPYYRDMFHSPSAIRGKTYISRWRTWRNTLSEFIKWANIEESQDNGSAPAIFTSTGQSDSTVKRKSSEADSREVRPGLRFKVFKRDGFRCVACGKSPANFPGVELHADHILAVANGGKTTLENLQTLCQICNLGKGSS